MKKILLLFAVTLLSVAAYAQDNYVSIGTTAVGGNEFFVNTNMRKNSDGYYLVWVKNTLVSDIQKERKKMKEKFGDSRYLKYDHTLVLYAIDVEERRTQMISIVQYTEEGEVLNRVDNGYYSAINWDYAIPGSMIDAIVSFVENEISQ